MDFDAVRGREPVGLPAATSVSWLPAMNSSGSLGFVLKCAPPDLGKEPEVKGVMPRLLAGEGRGTPSSGSSGSPLDA